MSKKTLGSDIFFLFQLVMAFVFAIPQVIRMTENVQGVTINWLLCADAFVILNLYLVLRAVRKNRSRLNLQAFVIYLTWVILVTPMVVLSFFKCKWLWQDTLVATFVALAAVLVVTVSKINGRTLSDPIVRGLLVGLFRVVPHLYLTFCIINAGGGGGIPAKTIIAANITATARIVTLFNAGRKSGWEGGTRASIVSEIANEGSWLLVTAVWFIWI